MYTRPMILPLDSTGRIYVLEDETGQVVGTGSREVCERLMDMINTNIAPTSEHNQTTARTNVHAAIKI